jgi:hypothetical protein
VHLCHCPTCRYTHGTLCIFHASLPRGVQPEFLSPTNAPLSAAATSYTHPHGANSERFFCSTCGAHFGDRDLEPDSETGEKGWRVATSLFDAQQDGEEVFQIRSHTFTDSALAGGLYEWLPAMGERAMHVWNPDRADARFPPPPGEADRPAQEFDDRGGERLRAECHCGGVSFTVPRPTVPEVVGDEFVSKFVSPIEKDKWMATLDLCDDCRLLDGTHVAAWTFVPRALIEPKVGPDLKLGTMKVYQSSKGVRRTFCGVCGATVLYACDDRKPSDESEVVDVAVGLVRAPEGVLAERWFTWRTGRIGWFEDGEKYDPVFAQSLKKGLEEWGRQKYSQTLDFEIL